MEDKNLYALFVFELFTIKTENELVLLTHILLKCAIYFLKVEKTAFSVVIWN